MFKEHYEQMNGHLLKAVDDALEEIENYYPEAYKKFEEALYVEINGYHFNEEMLKKATHCMINDDGSEAPKWNVEQTNSVANSLGFKFTDYNEYDFNYVMNMMYGDYVEIWGDSNFAVYGKMAIKFLMDKDAPKGKALRYYLAMKKW